jgi:arylformamidase
MPGAWLDATVALHGGMVVYEGDPPVELEPALSIERGDPANVSRLALGSHTGTHVDAPRHFVRGGAGVDALSPEVLIGPARVLQCPPGPVGTETLAAAGLGRGERLVLRTGNSDLWARECFVRDYQALTPAAARLLVDAGVALVGIDYLSIEPFGAAGYPVHRCLLEAGVVILEGLDLTSVRPGRYELCCLPLRIRDGDGAPARALLRPA